MKRTWTVTVIVALLAFPLVAYSAGERLNVGKAEIGEENTVTVPLEVTNQDDLVGIDIALKYSEGVTLKEVRFENSRIDYFDLKATMLDAEKRQIVIMAVPQTSMTKKPALMAGTGPVAYLVFERNDASVKEIEFEPFVMEDPHHSNFFVYGNIATGQYEQWREDPVIEETRVSLSAASGSMPNSFALKQNYPNPSNPSTEISFDLPKASVVELRIYNVIGQEVRTLANSAMEAGQHKIVWDGRDEGGSSVASGVYFYRLTAGSYTDTKKMMLLK